MPNNIVIVNGVRVDAESIAARIKSAVNDALERAAVIAEMAFSVNDCDSLEWKSCGAYTAESIRAIKKE